MKPLVIGASIVLIAGLAAAQVGGPQVGEKKEADPRVKRLLDKADLKYEIDRDGDYKMINRFDNNRTQLVFVNSRTVRLGEMEIREIWSVGYVSDGVMPDEIVKDLLEANCKVKLGGWELRRFSGKEAGVFRAQIAADTDELSLLMTLQAVSKTADDMEQEHLNNDDL